MIKARNAICWNCGGMMSMKERYSYKDISVQLTNGSSDGGAEKAYNTALTRFTSQLMEDNVIRVVEIKLEKVTRRKKKIATATYRYQADCDGEWGEIQFDFEKRKAVSAWCPGRAAFGNQCPRRSPEAEDSVPVICTY